jgi:hypothetical protein
MKHRLLTISLAGLLFGLIVGLAWQLRGWRRAELMRAELARQRAQLQARAIREEQALAELRRAKAASDGNSVALSPAAAPAAAEKPPGATYPSSFREWLEEPKVQVLYLASRRADLAQSYGPFFQSEGLSLEQIEKLCDLLIKHAADIDDVGAVREARGVSFDDPEIKALSERSLAEFTAGKIELLGAEGVRRLMDYERALPVWTYVGKVAGAAALENVPFSRQQAKDLAGMMTDTSGSYRRGGQAQLAEIDWKAVQSRAPAILSPEQMKLLQGEQQGRGSSPQAARFSQAVFRAINEMYPEKAGFNPSRNGGARKAAPVPGP